MRTGLIEVCVVWGKRYVRCAKETQQAQRALSLAISQRLGQPTTYLAEEGILMATYAAEREANELRNYFASLLTPEERDVAGREINAYFAEKFGVVELAHACLNASQTDDGEGT